MQAYRVPDSNMVKLFCCGFFCCFLLTFNNLFISEESVESRKDKVEITQAKNSGDGDKQEKVDLPFTWSRLLLCLLMLVWDVMIICTSLYFHTFVEKVLGTMCGVGAWYLLYMVLYPMCKAAIS